MATAGTTLTVHVMDTEPLLEFLSDLKSFAEELRRDGNVAALDRLTEIVEKLEAKTTRRDPD